jgi:hypothetical protein
MMFATYLEMNQKIRRLNEQMEIWIKGQICDKAHATRTRWGYLGIHCIILATFFFFFFGSTEV